MNRRHTVVHSCVGSLVCQLVRSRISMTDEFQDLKVDQYAKSDVLMQQELELQKANKLVCCVICH